MVDRHVTAVNYLKSAAGVPDCPQMLATKMMPLIRAPNTPQFHCQMQKQRETLNRFLQLAFNMWRLDNLSK